ncbi:MAG: ABC-2 transporter permease [Oscillospiraceae bacterium]|nr:ABC-2 transporter permease [Oscillospiraceae bacterium]MBR0450610.1 ABC-2 transporter permease [Oscillospiraceae bacterium]
MKALFRKDFYVITTTFKIIMIVWLIFPIVAIINPEVSFFILYIGLIAGTMSSTLISYEEREKWPLYAGTLPISRKQIITERYLFTLIMILLATAMGAVILAINSIRGYPASSALLVQIFSTSLIMPTFLLPLTYKYGVEKSRYIVMIIVIGFSIGSQEMLSVFENEKLSSFILPAMIIGSLALFAVSFLLSLKWYSEKEFH